MTTLQMVNVGQGDCFILRPGERCAYSGEAVIVDVGNGKTDFTTCLTNQDQKLHLVLTHSDVDHTGGIKYLFFNNLFERVKTIVMPFYHNEIILIAKALLQVKGVKDLPYVTNTVAYLEGLLSGHMAMKRLAEKMDCPQILFAHEGDSRYCNHFCYYNPPVRFVDMPDYLADDTLIESVIELMEESFGNDLRLYFEASRYMRDNMENRYHNAPQIHEIMFRQPMQSPEGTAYHKANFALSYFAEQLQRIQSFVETPDAYGMRRLVKEAQLKAHHTCLVFRYEDERGESVLFSGDASVQVLERIAQNQQIASKILKVPHHGSKNNLNEKVLHSINPEVAMISHNNRKFSRSNDTHPNREVLDLLQQAGVEILVSNDVIKDNTVVLSKKKPSKKNLFI